MHFNNQNFWLLRFQSQLLYSISRSFTKDLGQLDLSIRSLQKGFIIKSDYAEAYNNMGITLQEQENL